MRRYLFTAVAAVLVVGMLAWQAGADDKHKHDHGSKGAAVGSAAPQFSLKDQTGKTVNLSDHAGKVVVLEWINPQCPFVVRHYDAKTMQDLASKYATQGVVWLAIDSSSSVTPASSQQWAEKYDLSYPILQDPSGETGHAYGATNTPHMYVIGKDGKIAYAGAIDDDPKGNKADKVNYVDKALTEVLAGSNVSTPQTKAYGCSVKYAK